jgi:hypothetical protein
MFLSQTQIIEPTNTNGTNIPSLVVSLVHNFYTSPDIIRQINSRRMRWVGQWHAWERGEKCTGFWWESPKEKTT